MSTLADRLLRWARKLSAPHSDPFAPTQVLDTVAAHDKLIYRLRRWPKLPLSIMSTDVSRTLSVMSTRPVNRRWILSNSSLAEHEVDSMLQRLVEQGAVEVTDAGKYRPHASSA
jgi:hypothetical protein